MALWEIIRDNDIEGLKKALEKGVPGFEINSALQSAAQGNKIEMVKLILENKTRPRLIGTALSQAVARGLVEMANLLLTREFQIKKNDVPAVMNNAVETGACRKSTAGLRWKTYETG